MTTFVQLHLLTFYPPANLNRDDAGRPKTAIIGGAERQRISSQSLKRAVRTSALFEERLAGHVGQRTQQLGKVVLDHLRASGLDESAALKIARTIAGLFGKINDEKDKNPSYIAQLAFVSPQERAAALTLADRALAGEAIVPKADEILRRTDTAADIAMFGRMLADNPDFNREAAVQVAHAFTTHRVTIEDDYYTAIDDLKKPSEDTGAGFIGELGFASGLFYLYVCIDIDLLVRNLGGTDQTSLAKSAVAALIEALATVSPIGKQASFASRARASYMLAEKGSQQPRTLGAAFAQPIGGADILGASVAALQKLRADMDKAYGPCAEGEPAIMNVAAGKGSLAGIVALATGW